MTTETLLTRIENSIRQNWDRPALSDDKGATLRYGEAAAAILRLHTALRQNRIGKGDKVALLGKNAVNWALAYLATLTYGAIVVPILPDFHADEIQAIIAHSEAVALFVAPEDQKRIDPAALPALRVVFSLSDLAACTPGEARREPALAAERLTPAGFRLDPVDPADTAEIVYTSGTTGFSKGVVLSHRSLLANVAYAQENMPLCPGDRVVSFLPLAHAFGCAFDFLLPFTIACHITFLGKLPSPKIIIDAFQKARPRLILSVPLVIEKIYYNRLKPLISRTPVKVLLGLPVIGAMVRAKIRNQLKALFGGNFIEIVIGGAALNPEVELFFKKIKFPLTVGYGLTEWGPLVSYAPWTDHEAFSVGRVVDTLEIRIDSDDPRRCVGEILVRGANVMDGYFKNPEATAEAIDAGGWLHTGDLGVIDGNGFIHIRGRSKTMILGSAGQNIYPEEIEAKLNQMPFVKESLVMQKDGRIVALVCPEVETLDEGEAGQALTAQKMEENRRRINRSLPAYSAISKIILHPEEFVKTPTRKIKRVLYTDASPAAISRQAG